jgi:hypothetical protein
LIRSRLTESIAAQEARHVLGDPGEPKVELGWEASTLGPPAFYLDREGIVHLEGQLNSMTGTVVEGDGLVRGVGITKNEPISLDGITFRAGS